MRVEVRDIPAAVGSELALELELPAAWLAEQFDGTDLDLSAASGTARVCLQRSGAEVLVQGQAAAQVATPCSRCLEPARLDLESSFTLRFQPGTEPDRGGDIELTADDIDVVRFDGVTVDLAPTLREQLLLAIPMRALCRPDCKGLCPSCGKELNVGPCDCPKDDIDPRLAALLDVKIDC